MKFSHSSLNCYRKCPKMYYWRYVYGIEPMREPDAFVIGKLLHTLIEMYHNSSHKDRNKVIDMATYKTAPVMEKAAPEECEGLLTMIITATAMFKHMPARFLEGSSNDLVEQHFVIPIKDDIIYEGYIDRIEAGSLREIKTTVLPDHFIKYAAVSPQVSGYMMGCRTLGKDITTITYDLIRKPMLRKKANETMEQFHARIVEDYRDRPDFYYRREHTFRTTEQLDQFFRDLALLCVQVKAKVDMYKNGIDAFWRNHEACFARGECPYYKICFTKSKDKTMEQIFYKPVEGSLGHDVAQDID